MSRKAAKPIALPDKVKVEVKDGIAKISGPNGHMEVKMIEGIDVKMEDKKIVINRKNDDQKAFHGLIWSLVNNAVIGVTDGFFKRLHVVGKGWRSTVKGNIINLQVGYSHPTDFTLPAGVTAKQENPGTFTLHSYDKQLLGQVCANIKKIRPVEPYKQKGIRIEGQFVRTKVRKAAGV